MPQTQNSILSSCPLLLDKLDSDVTVMNDRNFHIQWSFPLARNRGHRLLETARVKKLPSEFRAKLWKSSVFPLDLRFLFDVLVVWS